MQFVLTKLILPCIALDAFCLQKEGWLVQGSCPSVDLSLYIMYRTLRGCLKLTLTLIKKGILSVRAGCVRRHLLNYAL